MPTELYSGMGRTDAMIGIIGSLMGQGYSAVEVKRQLDEMNINLCPEGHSPKPLSEMELEIYPAIERFEAKRKTEIELTAGPSVVPAPPTPLADGTVPPAPPAPEEEHTLEKWLDRFRFVESGSRIIDTTKEGRYSEYTLPEHNNKYANIYVGERSKLSSQWFRNQNRKNVRDTIYYPTAQKEIIEEGELFWNIYRPTSLQPPAVYDPAMVEPFLAHLRYLMPDSRSQDVFLNWMAFTVQKQTQRIPWCPLIISEQGVGKGFIYQLMMRLMGEQNCEMILPKRFDSPFNSYIGGSTLILVDEMKTPKGDGIDTIKTLISEPRVELNEKGKPEKNIKVYANFLAFTNHAGAIRLEESDRRFWVYKVRAKKHTPAYYEKLFGWLNVGGGANHILRMLLDRDLSGFKHATCPDSGLAKKSMIEATKGDIALGVQDAIEHREGIFAADIISFQAFKDYIESIYGTLTRSAEGSLRHIWAENFEALPQLTTGIMPLKDKGVAMKRVRVKCVRKQEYWANQPMESLQHELTRCIQMSVNSPAVLPPKMEIVQNGDTSEQPNLTRH